MDEGDTLILTVDDREVGRLEIPVSTANLFDQGRANRTLVLNVDGQKLMAVLAGALPSEIKRDG